MRSLKHRMGRAAAGFLVGALVLLPLTAHAAPAATAGDTSSTSWKDKDESKKDKKEEKKQDKAEGNGNSGNAPGNSGSAPGNSGSAPGHSGDAPGNSGNAPGHSGDAPGNSGNAPGDSAGTAVIALPEEEPSQQGLVPATPETPQVAASTLAPLPVPTTAGVGGFASIDTSNLPSHLHGAVMLFDQDDDIVFASAPPVAPTTGVSSSVIHTLAPVLPPALTAAVTSPVVVLEALIDAMASSGQALVIPFIAGLLGFLTPGVRRKYSISEALNERS